jgi:hypothetical protein
MNTIFSFHRMYQLAKHHYITGKKSALLKIAGFCISIVLVLFISQAVGNNYLNWSDGKYQGIFSFFYIFGGILYFASSFKWLRTKESRFYYFMVPATTFEKYLFEFLNKIVAYIVLVPFIYWFLANLEGTIFHLFCPGFTNFQCALSGLVFNIDFSEMAINSALFIGINSFLLVALVPFVGVTFFKKSPFPKVLLSLVVILISVIIYVIILFKIFGFRYFSDSTLEYIIPQHFSKILTANIFLTLTNLTVLFMGFYNIKEKEV